MAFYSRIPNLRLRREVWGGIVKLPKGGIVLIQGQELFRCLEHFSPTHLEDCDVPDEVAMLLQYGLVIRQDSERSGS